MAAAKQLELQALHQHVCMVNNYACAVPLQMPILTAYYLLTASSVGRCKIEWLAGCKPARSPEHTWGKL